MQLITLNIWGGKVFEPLISFIKNQSSDTDIYCFQEVFNNSPEVKSLVQPDAKQDVYNDIEKVLPDFDGYYHSSQDGEESLTMFIRKGIIVKNIGDIFVYRWKNAMEGINADTYGINLQHATLENEGKTYTICNLHGHWTPDFKGDNPARLEQSKNINKFLYSIDGPKILCGDFNLAPGTQSMALLERSMINLVKENNVTTTRSHYYQKPVKFADYILVSPEVDVEKFKVLDDVVSDHLPLLLRFQ
jgi:exonuclease III